MSPHHHFGMGVVGAALAVLAACGSSGASGTGNGDPDAGADEGGVTNPPGCPATAPTFNSSCSVAGTTCRYGACGTTLASCEAGRWNMPSSPAPTACPEIVPDNGARCCASAGTICSYDCEHGKGYNSTAECTNGTWLVSGSLSPCSAADAGADAGCTVAGSACCDPFPGDGPNYCANGLQCCQDKCAVTCN